MPLAIEKFFLDLLLVFVVARITHVALPCELTEKLTGTTVRAWFLQIEIDSHTTPIFLLYSHILYTYTRGRLLCLLGFWPLGQHPAGAINAVRDEKRPQFTDFVTLVNEIMELEKYIVTTTNKLHSFNKEWSNFLNK